jgi:hypothetical protein
MREYARTRADQDSGIDFVATHAARSQIRWAQLRPTRNQQDVEIHTDISTIGQLDLLNQWCRGSDRRIQDLEQRIMNDDKRNGAAPCI